jgi:hypothetical protein
MADVETITRTVTIAPGESFTLPAGATVVSMTNTLQNSCNFALPNPEPFVEYNYKFSINEDDNDDHPMGSEVNINSIS